MADSRRASVLHWLLALAALLPLLLFAYLGQFSRLMVDDYCHVATGRDLGFWDNLLYWRNNWNGSYSDRLLHGLLAGLDTSAASVLPAAVIGLWLLGLLWLLRNSLDFLQFRSHRFPIALVLAALTLAAAINAFSTLEPLLWYAASVRYTLPLALLTLFLAAVAEAIRRMRSHRVLALATVAAGLFNFFIAGFAEMFLVFQFVSLALLLAVFIAGADRSHRRVALPLLAAGCLATLLSLILQWNTPGVALRSEWQIANVSTPIRSLPELILATIDETFQVVTHQRVFAGFALSFTLGLSLALFAPKPTPQPAAREPIVILARPLWITFIAQLCFIPILWTHTSDNPQFLGRFSPAYMTIICLNAAAVFGILALLWQQDRVSAALRKHSNGLMLFSALILLLALALFGIAQIRCIHFKAAGHLYISAVSLLGYLSWLLLTAAPSARTRQGFALVVSCFAALALAAAALVLRTRQV